jgi:hypothetical protein
MRQISIQAVAILSPISGNVYLMHCFALLWFALLCICFTLFCSVLSCFDRPSTRIQLMCERSLVAIYDMLSILGRYLKHLSIKPQGFACTYSMQAEQSVNIICRICIH